MHFACARVFRLQSRLLWYGSLYPAAALSTALLMSQPPLSLTILETIDEHAVPEGILRY